MSSMSAIRDLISWGIANHERGIPSSEKKEEENRLDIVGLLPDEIALKVLNKLYAPADLATCSKVCRRWRNLSNDNSLWREFIEDKEMDSLGPSVKEFISKQCSIPGAIFYRSHDVVMQHLEDFFRNIPEGQKGRFRVILSQRNEEITFVHAIVDTMVDYMRSPDLDPKFIKTCFLIHNKIDPGVTYRDDSSHGYSICSSGNKSIEVYSGHKYIFYRSDIKARIETYFEKFNEIVDEKVDKFRNEPCKKISYFKRVINYCNEHRIITGVGVLCITNLVPYLINNNQ